MTAFEFIKDLNEQFPCVPMFMNGNKPVKASNGQIKRWLDMNAVSINGNKPRANDEIEFPVKELTFFPKNPTGKCSLHFEE